MDNCLFWRITFACFKGQTQKMRIEIQFLLAYLRLMYSFKGQTQKMRIEIDGKREYVYPGNDGFKGQTQKMRIEILL